MSRAVPVLFACAAALAGCAQPRPRDDVPPPPRVALCQAEAAQFTLGQAATPMLVEQAEQRAGASRSRVIRPGMVMTMEFDDARLILDVDAANRVTRVRCG